MPAVKGKSPILAKLKAKGAAKAWDAHKADEVDYGMGGDLPGGIRGGVAQLNDARLGEYKTGERQGEPYLYLSGVVHKPEEYMGMRASITQGLTDDPKSWNKPKSMEENIAAAQNEMKKMGINMEGTTLDDWEALLEALKQEAPFFRFHTTESKKPDKAPKDWKPKVYTNFDGLAKNFESNGAPGVDDQTGTEPGDGAGATEAGEDWDALAEAADNSNDAEACQKIKDACVAAGISEEDVDAFGNWAEAVAALKEAGGGDAGDAGGAAEPWKPEVGHFYPFKAKGAKKAEDYEVTHVMKDTMNLKCVADPKKVVKGVKWTSEPATIDGQPI